MPHPSLKTPDQVALDLLARRVRLLSLEQLARVVAPDARDLLRAGRAWAERFARAGLVETYQVIARTPRPASTIAEFELGGSPPDFQALSRTLKERAATVSESMLVVRLGREGEKLFGVKQPRQVRRSEASHDLQLAEVALAYLADPRVDSWTSEEQLLRSKAYLGLVPDAEARFVGGGGVAIEGGGIYSKGKLAGFHAAITPQLEARGLSGYRIV